jgi:hypothetical protein
MGGAFPEIVIAGLDPAIHRPKGIVRSLMDARVKPAHDGRKIGYTP